MRPCSFDWVKTLREECVARDITFCFLETGTVFIKDGRKYIIKGKRLQTNQALKAGMNYEGKPMQFNLVDSWGMPIPKEMLYVPHYCENCEGCVEAPMSYCPHCGARLEWE